MNILILAVIASILILGLVWLDRKFPNKQNLFIKIITILFIACFAVRLVTVDAFNEIINLQCDYLTPVGVVFMLCLRAITYVSVIIVALTPFYSCKTTQIMYRYIVPIIALLNIIFINPNIMCFYGAENAGLLSVRGLIFGLEIVLMLALTVFAFIKNIKLDIKKIKNKDFSKAFAMFLLLIIAVLPVATFNILFGQIGEPAEDFSLLHRIMLYITVAVCLLLFFGFRKHEKNIKELVLVYLSTACLIQFFYTIDITNLTYGNLPLHLCNMGVFLVFIAYVFRCKPVYYFTFFVNVIGCIFAILLPDTTGTLFDWDNIRFWYNHIYVGILPILGCVWKVYERPNLKMMRGAIYIFTIYFVAMIFANSYINTFGSVDYFFLQEDSISGHADFLRKLQLLNVLSVEIGGVVYSTYWAYDIFLYFGYIILMFIIWLFYTMLFKVQDHYVEVATLSKIDRLQYRETKRKLFGVLTNPLNPRGKKMINISHFTKVYGNSNVKSVDDFSLKIKEGEVFGFLGHNGAGKSTLIKSMVGIQSITEGKIEICGFDIEKQPLQAKELIGYVSDNHAVYEHLTGREYVNYVADLYNVSEEDRTEVINKYVSKFNLSDAFDKPIKSYSHGMKQKIVVIATLVHNPKVWILDEPLTGLDPTSAFEIKECMKEHADKGNIVFFSSHVIEVVEKICDRIAIIKKGKLQGVYDLKQLKEQNIELEDLYMSFIEGKDEEEKAENVIEDVDNSPSNEEIKENNKKKWWQIFKKKGK